MESNTVNISRFKYSLAQPIEVTLSWSDGVATGEIYDHGNLVASGDVCPLSWAIGDSGVHQASWRPP